MNDIQKTILEIYKNVSSICARHKIPFYAIGGTCIGAVRHNGFIPWDDDLDIAIPIQYYNQFWEIAEKELPENLKTYTCKNVRYYKYIFGKIHNTDTTFIEKAELNYKESYKGIFIDIMPISAVPENENEREIFYKKIQNYERLNFIRRYPFKEMYSLKIKLLWILMRPFCVFRDLQYYSDKWLNLLYKYPLGSSSKTGYTWTMQVRKLTFPMKDFDGVVELPFENTTIRCPVGYDDYLTMQFGDYMKFPPENQRAPHQTAIIDISKPYKKYYKE